MGRGARDRVRAQLGGVSGLAEVRHVIDARGRSTFYVVLETRDAGRDFVIAERLMPLGVAYQLVPRRAADTIPRGAALECAPTPPPGDAAATRAERCAALGRELVALRDTLDDDAPAPDAGAIPRVGLRGAVRV